MMRELHSIGERALESLILILIVLFLLTRTLGQTFLLAFRVSYLL